jgi:hypothetical protein
MTDVTITGSEGGALPASNPPLLATEPSLPLAAKRAPVSFLAWPCLSSRASTRASTPRMSSCGVRKLGFACKLGCCAQQTRILAPHRPLCL